MDSDIRYQIHASDHSTPRWTDQEADWKPVRPRDIVGTNNGNGQWSTGTPSGAERNSVHLQDAINQELIDLLRSQIARLLEENERILVNLDEYRERMAAVQRMQNESAVDPSVEHMALQLELGDSRLREAELTVAFGELQERISQIDRMIETDPEMEAFFNAVTISTTAMSKQKPTQRTAQSQAGSPMTNQTNRASQSTRSRDPIGQSLNQRVSGAVSDQSPVKRITNVKNRNSVNRSDSFSIHNTNDLDSIGAGSRRSGLESPQSDSGCSLNSHMTSEATDYHLGRNEKHSTFSLQKQRSETQDPDQMCQNDEDLEQAFNEDRTFQSTRPKEFTPLLRRSRSSAADHPYYFSGFRTELSSPMFGLVDREPDCNRHADDTPTPTGAAHVSAGEDEDGLTESKSTDRFSRLRASFRKSFGFGPSKPDFRMEAFAARQGEARALLSLRETRMELLRVQSRCQTLQRHVERLEAVNASRMEELESSVTCERGLRQDIRALQRRIFELEAEHREYKVNQRIKEMELMSKLAETNLRLSNAELTSQQAVVWSELSKAHEVAAGLLTPANSHLSVYPQNGNSPQSPGEQIPGYHTDRSRQERIATNAEAGTRSVKRISPNIDRSMSRLEAGKHQENEISMNRIISCNDLSDTKIPSQHGKQSLLLTDQSQSRRAMEQSIGSLSDLRLQPDPILTHRSGNWR